MNTRILSVCLLLTVATVACKKGAASGSGEGGVAAADDKKGGAKIVTIDGAGLQFQAPPDLGDVTAMMGSYTYPCCGGAAVQINPVKADSLTAAKTLDEAKKSTNDFKNPKLTKAEATADGWRVEYDHDTGMGRTFKILIRHTFDGKGYDCEADSDDAKKTAVAVKACETLAPVGGAKVAAGTPAAAGSGATTTTAASVAGGATAGGGSVCVKAAKCCHILSGDTAPSCDKLLKSPDATCTASLSSFKKAVKATKPKQAADCD